MTAGGGARGKRREGMERWAMAPTKHESLPRGNRTPGIAVATPVATRRSAI